jgi:hypothetical protein
LVALQNGELDALVGPQAVEGSQTFLRHMVFNSNFGICCDELGVTLANVVS